MCKDVQETNKKAIIGPRDLISSHCVKKVWLSRPKRQMQNLFLPNVAAG